MKGMKPQETMSERHLDQLTPTKL